ncbi:hypothetical protein [Aestuariivirga sp.]|uniref:hypothetical protein n=1 Tax=Aestuariivirga sp. TaxID=2650926 RepID=UPI003BA99E4A
MLLQDTIDIAKRRQEFQQSGAGWYSLKVVAGSAIGAAAILGGPSAKVAGKAASIAIEEAGVAFKDFTGALSETIKWLEGRGSNAEQATIGKFGENAGRPIGMKSASGKSGFRVEFDERHGAHINAWSGKEKQTFSFEGSQSMVNQIVKQFEKERP